MGRTKKEINWEYIQAQIEIGCTAKEMYDCMCDSDTFYKRFKEHFGENFSDYSAKFRSVGAGHIKATQYLKARAGNIPMLQLMGRELCGQGQDPEKISPYEDTVALRHANMLLQARLDKLEGYNGDQPQTE